MWVVKECGAGNNYVIIPKKPVFGGYIGMGVVRPVPDTGFSGIITFIQRVTNI
jgi:hypothetical protein